jgi:hypothetical protein
MQLIPLDSDWSEILDDGHWSLALNGLESIHLQELIFSGQLFWKSFSPATLKRLIKYVYFS